MQNRRSPFSPVLCLCGTGRNAEMDYEYATEEFVDEVNDYCRRRRRTVSETERRDLWPAELLRQTSDRSSAKNRVGQSISPPRRDTAASNGCSSHVGEDGSRVKTGKRKMGDWLLNSQHRRHLAADERDVEMAEPAAAEAEFRPRSGSHGLRDLLRIRPRFNSHGEKSSEVDSPAYTCGRGYGATLSPGAAPGTVTSSASSSASSSTRKFRLFLDAFRHRAHSDSISTTRSPFRGWYHFTDSDSSSGTHIDCC